MGWVWRCHGQKAYQMFNTYVADDFQSVIHKTHLRV